MSPRGHQPTTSSPAPRPGAGPPAQTRALAVVVTEVINLCGEPVVFYDAAETGPPGPATVARVIPVDRLTPPARLRETPVGPERVAVAAGTTVPVRDLQIGPVVENLPDPQTGVAYIVPLAVALAARRRHDLLVPADLVRDGNGAVLGCRALARPL